MAVRALDGKPMTQAEMDELTRFRGAGIGTWPYHAAMELAQSNYDVVLHESFDLSAFVANPQDYVRQFYPVRSVTTRPPVPIFPMW